MKLAEIQNGLSHAGNVRKRNYEDRACVSKPKILMQPTHGQLSKAFKQACKIIAVQDEFIKSNTNNKFNK